MPSNDRSASSKVKLIAIAKDESAYFAEWIAHHLHCGFDSIDIYINRTRDNSITLLEKVCAAYPEVKFFEADWIDTAGPKAAERLQFIIYAMALDKLKRDSEYTHVCFLDIDEFWVHQEKDVNIKTFVDGFDPNDVIYLEWLVDFGRDLPFSLIPNVIEAYISPLGKCIYPVNADIEQVRLHISIFKSEQNVVLADGRKYLEDNSKQQALISSQSSLKPCFIFHRANRSQMEYISLTLRGRPSSNFPFKENRNGLPDDQKQKLTLSLNGDLYTERDEMFEHFLMFCDIQDDYYTARAFVDSRYNDALERVQQNINEHYDVMLRIFAGVKDRNLTKYFTAYRNRLVMSNPKDADLIRDLAIEAYHQDIEECVSLINKAHKLRPDGPMINKLRERYLLALDTQKPNKAV